MDERLSLRFLVRARMHVSACVHGGWSISLKRNRIGMKGRKKEREVERNRTTIIIVKTEYLWLGNDGGCARGGGDLGPRWGG